MTRSFGSTWPACSPIESPTGWVVIATQAVDGRSVDERLRAVLVRLVLGAAQAELWEPRAD